MKVVSLQHQNTPEHTFFTHTGWTTKVDGKPVFLTPHGPRGRAVDPGVPADTYRTSTPEKLSNYCIPETVTQQEVLEAYGWVERLMLCGDSSVTAPLVAAIFLAPLASKLNLDFALFLTGHTGTHKSSLVAAAMSLWGKSWSKDTLPISFIASANAIEMMGFRAKDLPLPIDNYVPDRNGDARGEAQQKLKRISHSIGDHQGRDRLKSNTSENPAKPFRCFSILTGEDLPYQAGAGATNRYYVVPMTKSSLKLMDLEQVQEAGWAGKLAPAMTHYLSYLTEKMQDPAWISRVIAYHYQLEKAARREAAGKDHDRLTSQTAWIMTGLELARQAHPARQWMNCELPRLIKEGVGGALMARRTISREASLPYRLFTAVMYLIESGVIHGVNARTGDAPPDPDIFPLMGWKAIDHAPFFELKHRLSRCAIWTQHDPSGVWWICMRPSEIVTEIKQTLRGQDCPIVETVRGVGVSLLSEGYLNVDMLTDGDHLAIKLDLWKGNSERPRVWKIRGDKFLQCLGQASAAPPDPSAV